MTRNEVTLPSDLSCEHGRKLHQTCKPCNRGRMGHAVGCAFHPEDDVPYCTCTKGVAGQQSPLEVLPLPERITIDDGNPAGPRVYHSGKVVTTLERERDELRRALERIADMPIDPRPDGTHNYCRAALIQIAGMALGRGK